MPRSGTTSRTYVELEGSRGFPLGNLSQQLLLLLTGSLVDFLKTPSGIKLNVNKLLDMAAQVRRLAKGMTCAATGQ